MLGAALATVASCGGGPVTVWLPGAEDDRATQAEEAGLRLARTLYEMRIPLPVADRVRLDSRSLPMRPFRPGLDDQAWLRVNNRAFAWHPEQGGWDLGTLRAQFDQAWFDPAGFLLHDFPAEARNHTGAIDGFCWTKVHAATDRDPAIGEIYVIAADPAAAGGGFGRRLVLAGLDHLSAAGLAVGMLYTEADNVRAVRLYVDLGFVVHSLRRAYVGIVAAPAVMPAAH